jgi:aldehyde dehydrogenase (NAD+)
VAAAQVAVDRDGEWRSLGPSERGRRLDAMADAIEDRKEEIAEVESHDNGKTPFEASLDVDMVIDTFRYYAGWTDKIQGDEVPVPGDRLNYTVREPVGVTGHVIPWNYPFQLAGRSLAPALACGNTAV